MLVSSIRVAIFGNDGHDPFPATCQDPVVLSYFNDFEEFRSADAAIYVDSSFEFEPIRVEALTHLLPAVVLVNAVEIPGNSLPAGFIRYNGWPGFNRGNVLEIAGDMDNLPDQLQLFAMACGLTCLAVPDKVGLVRPRILAMIINEAYYAEGEGVGTAAAIDMAMKLGTNYPFGPFEWGDLIGIRRVKGLLDKLSEIDSKYLPAPALVAAAQIK